jgi:hypothetical protein
LAVAVGAAVWWSLGRTTGTPGPDSDAAVELDQLATTARTAPGTEVLREAGCETALVFDGREALEAFGPLLLGLGGFREDVTVVVCGGAPTQDCGALARRFAARSDSPPDRFFLMASGSANDPGTGAEGGSHRGAAPASLCSGLFDADGQELDPTAPEATAPPGEP